jgi:hypothetical protein
VWGLLWDEGNLALAGRYGATREEADALYAADDWIVRGHPRRPGQVILIGATPAGRVLAIAAQRRRVRGAVGWRIGFRPISVQEARAWMREAYRAAGRTERGYAANVYRADRGWPG